MLATMLVATHSHSPWSSLPRERICRVPPGSVLCLLLLGFPTLGKEQGGPGKERKNTTQKRVAGQGEAAAGSLSYLRGPGDTAGHHQGIWSLRSRQGSRFPRFREDLAGQRKRHASGRLVLSTRTQAENPMALTQTPSPEPELNLQHPKLKPLQREAYQPPSATLSQAREGTACLTRCPNCSSVSASSRGEAGPFTSWAARAQRRRGRMACMEVPKSSQAKWQEGSWNNSCLRPSAKVVQIPSCLESSPAVLHAGGSAD